MESSKKKNFRKKTAAVVSAVLIVALLLAGTYAYLAGSSALNQWQGKNGAAGGVGRDDYEEGKPNKDVFVENKGNTILYARIKLKEYFEMTKANGIKEILVGEDSATKTPSEGWITHMDGPESDGKIPLGSVAGDDGEAHEYWEWIMGGAKVYMPSPYDAITEDGKVDGDAYGDTTHYKESDMATNQELKKTPAAEVMTYEQWADKGGLAGNYWVIDRDGWIYWANPILPGEATGLLLDAVNGPDTSEFPEGWKDYYYAINVNFEFWDAADWEGKYEEADDGGKEVLDAAKVDETVVNKDALKDLIEQAKDIRDNQSDKYKHDANWDNLFNNVLPEGEEVYGNDDATQAEVDQAVSDLQDALDALTKALKLLETETGSYIHVQFYKDIYASEMEVEEDWSNTYDMSKILENPAEATTLTIKSARVSGGSFTPVTLSAGQLIGEARVENGQLKPWVVFPFATVKEYLRLNEELVSDLTMDVVVNFSQNVMVEGSLVTLTSKDYTIHIEYIDSSIADLFLD